MDAITSFSGPYSWLSNFWMEPIVYEGNAYASVEHAFQAAKTLDPREQDYVAAAPTPGIAKRRGRTVHLRPDWEQVKEKVMLDLLRIKFRHIGLRAALQGTQLRELVEGNHWGDTYWGVDHRLGGQNRLGMLLMQVRSECAKADMWP